MPLDPRLSVAKRKLKSWWTGFKYNKCCVVQRNFLEQTNSWARNVGCWQVGCDMMSYLSKFGNFFDEKHEFIFALSNAKYLDTFDRQGLLCLNLLHKIDLTRPSLSRLKSSLVLSSCHQKQQQKFPTFYIDTLCPPLVPEKRWYILYCGKCDRFVEAGGNFIDTADVYSRGAAEEVSHLSHEGRNQN